MKVTPSVGKVTTASLCVAGLVGIGLWYQKHRKQQSAADQLRPVELTQQEQSFIDELARRLAMAEPGPGLVSSAEARRIAEMLEESQEELRLAGLEPVGNLALRLQATLGGARHLDEGGLHYLEQLLLKLQQKDPLHPPAEPAPRPRRRLPRRDR